MTEWIDDLDLAPKEGEWVLGAIPLDPEDASSNDTISEMVIYDSGSWTDTRGIVVNPLAWAKVSPYKPRTQARYDWEKDLAKIFDETREYMPLGFCLMGLAVGNFETGEGALITDKDTPDPEMSIWNADVAQDIMGDAQFEYETAVLNMRGAFKRTH